MNLQVASNEASLFPSPRVPFSEPSAKEVRRLHRSLANGMNQARKGYKAGSKMAPTRLENGTNQARKGYKAGSKMAPTRLENGTNQARKWHEPGSKMAQTRLENGTNQARKKQEPARKILQFVRFRLEAGHAKWLEPRHDGRIDVTQMTGYQNLFSNYACNPIIQKLNLLEYNIKFKRNLIIFKMITPHRVLFSTTMSHNKSLGLKSKLAGRLASS